MVLRYLDTSAAMKLVVAETESASLVEFLRNNSSDPLISSRLLLTELHCAAARNPHYVPAAKVAEVLARVLLVDVERDDLVFAAGLARLRAADAIHLATAARVGATELIAYDAELLSAGLRFGITPVRPGGESALSAPLLLTALTGW